MSFPAILSGKVWTYKNLSLSKRIILRILLSETTLNVEYARFSARPREILDTWFAKYGRKYHAEKPRNMNPDVKSFTRLFQNELSTITVNPAQIRKFMKNTKGCPNDRRSKNAEKTEYFKNDSEYFIETFKSSGKIPTENSNDIPPRNCRDVGLNANSNDAIRAVKSDILRLKWERNSRRNKNIETLKRVVVVTIRSFKMSGTSTPSATRTRKGSLIGMRIICSKVGWDIIWFHVG